MQRLENTEALPRYEWLKAEGRPASQVAGYLAAWGCNTASLLTGRDLLSLAQSVFGISNDTTVASTANRIAGLSKRDRHALVLDAVRRRWPKPCALWPADARIREGLSGRAGVPDVKKEAAARPVLRKGRAADEIERMAVEAFNREEALWSLGETKDGRERRLLQVTRGSEVRFRSYKHEEAVAYLNHAAIAAAIMSAAKVLA